jgi:uncharacterized protein YcnI
MRGLHCVTAGRFLRYSNQLEKEHCEMSTNSMRVDTLRRRLSVLLAAGLGALALAGTASAHARVSPAVSVSNKLQLYSLTVPTEKSGLTTMKIVLTVPSGFGIDSFVPPPAGWSQTLQQSGSGNNAVITKVTWTGGHTPTGEDSLFQFLAQGSSNQTYTFRVEQTYSDGSIVDWAGPESSDHPSPTIDAVSSLGGGGGSSLVAILALILGVLGLIAGGFALVSRGGGDRPLA